MIWNSLEEEDRFNARLKYLASLSPAEKRKARKAIDRAETDWCERLEMKAEVVAEYEEIASLELELSAEAGEIEEDGTDEPFSEKFIKDRYEGKHNKKKGGKRNGKRN